MPTSTVRPGIPALSPYLIFRDARKAMDFYQAALGAVEISCHADASGAVMHAEMRGDDSTFMLVSENPKFDFMCSVETMGGSPVHFFLYVHDVDTRFQQAIDAGAKVLMPVAEQPYGRSGGFTDPFGHTWWLSTHKEPG